MASIFIRVHRTRCSWEGLFGVFEIRSRGHELRIYYAAVGRWRVIGTEKGRQHDFL